MKDSLNIGLDEAFYSRDQLIEKREKEQQADDLYRQNRTDPAEVSAWIAKLSDELTPAVVSILERFSDGNTMSADETAIADILDGAIRHDADRRIFE